MEIGLNLFTFPKKFSKLTKNWKRHKKEQDTETKKKNGKNYIVSSVLQVSEEVEGGGGVAELGFTLTIT